MEAMMTMAVSKAVLITGCSTGIGRATAERLARSGHTVYASARRLESIADLAQHGCTLLALDVCDEASMQAAVAAVERDHGAVGVLINNAGYGSEGPVEEVPIAEVRRQFETNVFGLLRLTQLVLPGMRRQRWGKVVNISSMGGRMTLPGGGVYHASKYAVEALSDALRFEVRGFGIDVIVIEPGAIRTEFGATAIARVDALGGSPDYAAFRAVLKQQIENAYDGRMAAFAVAPDVVAKVIARAITAARPKTRYVITAGARIILALRRMLPDRAFDALLRTQFQPPRPA
jgi:NAD(P)-dependent dehydrogenase (short-subunit alcohol dehydrogenase family)